MSQSAMEEVSMSVDKAHLLTFRTAAAAFRKTVQDVLQEGAELFLSGGLKITDESRDRHQDNAIYTVRIDRQVLERLRKESDKRDVSVSVVFRAWAIELNRKHKFEISYQPIDFKKFLPKDFSSYEEVQAVEVVKGKTFAARIHVPIEPPFQEGAKFAKGRKVSRVDVDKQGKFWVLYIINA
jgi:hypothetical protein